MTAMSPFPRTRGDRLQAMEELLQAALMEIRALKADDDDAPAATDSGDERIAVKTAHDRIVRRIGREITEKTARRWLDAAGILYGPRGGQAVARAALETYLETLGPSRAVTDVRSVRENVRGFPRVRRRDGSESKS
jgi:hypothetical protein